MTLHLYIVCLVEGNINCMSFILERLPVLSYTLYLKLEKKYCCLFVLNVTDRGVSTSCINNLLTQV